MISSQPYYTQKSPLPLQEPHLLFAALPFLDLLLQLPHAIVFSHSPRRHIAILGHQLTLMLQRMKPTHEVLSVPKADVFSTAHVGSFAASAKHHTAF